MGIRRTLFGLANDVLRPDSLLGAGSEAPDFDLEAHDGSRVRSVDLRAEGKHLVLIFYPGDDTPGCTLQLKAFSDRAEDFAAERALVDAVAERYFTAVTLVEGDDLPAALL